MEKSSFALSCDYQQYQLVKKIFEDFTLYDVSEDFGEKISISGQVASRDAGLLSSRIFDSTNGKCNPTLSDL